MDFDKYYHSVSEMLTELVDLSNLLSCCLDDKYLGDDYLGSLVSLVDTCIDNISDLVLYLDLFLEEY